MKHEELISAARRKAITELERRQHDRAAEVLYRFSSHLGTEARKMVESSPVYARGRDMFNADPEVIHDAPTQNLRYRLCELLFKAAHTHYPENGEVLTFRECVKAHLLYYIADMKDAAAAWAVAFPEKTFPLKFDGERRVFMELTDGGEWIETDKMARAERMWSNLAEELTGKEDPESLSGVMFNTRSKTLTPMGKVQ